MSGVTSFPKKNDGQMREECWLSKPQMLSEPYWFEHAYQNQKMIPSFQMQNLMSDISFERLLEFLLTMLFFCAKLHSHWRDKYQKAVHFLLCQAEPINYTVCSVLLLLFCRWHSSPYWHKRNSRFRKTHCSFSARLSAGTVCYTWYCSKTASSKFLTPLLKRETRLKEHRIKET